MPFDVFLSYAHKDNLQGQVRELRDAILEDFQRFAGRDLSIFFDEHDIPSMVDWDKRIAQGLRESRLFLAVISPNYFASPYCIREWSEYTRYEAMRQCLGEGVAPVYFIELPRPLESGGDPSIVDLVTEMRKRQWCDLATQAPVKIVPWHQDGKRALEDAEVARRLRVLKEQMAERLSRADRARNSATNIFRHNPQFVGRVRELTLLRETLNERGSVGVVGFKSQTMGAAAIHGLGGMGKTELALAYAHCFAWDYPGGRWLARCEGLESFDLVLRQLAEPLGVTFTEAEQKDVQLAGERILAELRQRERSLLLLDNVTHPAVLAPDVLMRLPAQGHVHLIATTRLGPAQLAGSAHDHTFVAVDELPHDDALALIRAHQPLARFDNADDEVAARELVRLLDGFTLAVETAAIYLGRQAAPGSISTYVKRLGTGLLAESESAATDATVAVRHKEKLLERTLAITFETLTAEQLHVLTLAALLPADQVVLSWLHAITGHTYPALKFGEEQSNAAWEKLAASLLSLRLIQTGDHAAVARVHRLVQEMLRKRVDGLPTILKAVLAEHIRNRAHFNFESWIHAHDRWELRPLMMQARLWLQESDQNGFDLTRSLARPLIALAAFSDAEALLRAAVTRAKELYGDTHFDSGHCLSNLAVVLLEMNRYAEAEAAAREAVRTFEQLQGSMGAEVAGALNNLGLILAATNQTDEAAACYRRAIAIVDTSLGGPDASNARLLANYADVLAATNQLAEAEAMYVRALQIYDACYGAEHPDLAQVVNNLFAIFYKTGRLREAEPLIRHAISIVEKCYGVVHLRVTAALLNLAMILDETGRRQEAEQVVKRCMEILERNSSNGPRLAQCYGILGGILRDTNRLVEAEQYYRRGLTLLESSFGANHPKVSTTLNNLAGLLRATRRLEEAETMYRRVLAIDAVCYSPFDPEAAIHFGNLAGLLEQTNRLTEAKELRERSLIILFRFSRTSGYPHPVLQRAMQNYVTLLMHLGLSEPEILTQLKRLEQLAL